MKIRETRKEYEEVCKSGGDRHLRPVRQSTLLRKLFRVISAAEMKAVGFTCEKIGMEKLGKAEPALYLMNHSSFTDIQIIGTLLSDREYHIVCTNDGFIGKAGFMQHFGCIPTKKFIMDASLVRDMKYCFKTLQASVVMYPEASYSFDGSETPLPMSLAKCLKLMQVPVVMIKTEGAFLRDPLYNNLQKRDTKVHATMTYLLSPEEIAHKTTQELYEILQEAFSYDHFRAQYAHGVIIDEPFRADGLHRVLYRCPSCHGEGHMKGEGVHICCGSCGKRYLLQENGLLQAEDGVTEFEYITDWYAWEREQVRKEVEAGTYEMDLDVEIRMLVDYSRIYHVGEGRLHHDRDGFVLDGCDDRLHFKQAGNISYSLYADYFWYEIGDMISIGDNKAQYYCFPKNQENAIVAKARLATEEIYRLTVSHA